MDLRNKYTLTIPYDDATTLPFMRAYHNPVKSAETVATRFSATNNTLNWNLGHGQSTSLNDIRASDTSVLHGSGGWLGQAS